MELDIIKKYNFYVGTSRGTLLFNNDNPSKIQSAKTENASAVTALVFGRNENEALVGYENGCFNIYNISEKKYTKGPELEGEGAVVGIGCVNESVVIARHDGIVNIWNDSTNDYFDIHLEEKGSLDTLVYNSNRKNIVGTGGEFNDFKLWDVETHQCIFKAKSLGHDMLNLPIPTSVRGITFFEDDSYLIACATKEGHVLLYDDRAQRRPVVKFLEKKASYTTITTAYRERQCLVGTTRGYLQRIDMKAGKCMKTFTNFTGSVTSIVCDPVEPYVISTSLDRHLRIHNLETKELMHKVYMKQSLTRVLIKPVVKDEVTEIEGNIDEEHQVQNESKGKEEENIDAEYEELFKNMPTVGSNKKFKKQKRHSEVINENPKKSKRKKIKQNKD